MSIVFVLARTPNPRMDKRIGLLKRNYSAFLIYWKKQIIDMWNFIHHDINAKEIYIEANFTDPLKRIIPTIKFGFCVIKYLFKMEPKYIYTENIDMLLICLTYSLLKKRKIRPKIIYEIADLHKLIIDKQNNIIKKITKQILMYADRKCSRYVDLLVLTSEKFYEVYFNQFYPKEKVIVIPNMPDLKLFTTYKRKTTGPFTVGFIGIVRYQEQMKMLLSAAQNCKVNVLFAGSGINDEIEKLCINKPNVEYYGKYNYETEISSLYEKCDCIYSVYNADLNNVKVALPNKLYEAIYCGLPIIVAKGTYLSELTLAKGVGVAINHRDQRELEQVLNRLSADKEYYDKFVECCYAQREYINNEIHNKELLKKIQGLIE